MYLISSKVFCRVEYREKNNSGTSLTNARTPPLEVGTNARAHYPQKEKSVTRAAARGRHKRARALSTYCNMSRYKKRPRHPLRVEKSDDHSSVLDSALNSERTSARSSRKSSRTNSATASRSASRSSSRIRGLSVVHYGEQSDDDHRNAEEMDDEEYEKMIGVALARSLEDNQGSRVEELAMEGSVDWQQQQQQQQQQHAHNLGARLQDISFEDDDEEEEEEGEDDEQEEYDGDVDFEDEKEEDDEEEDDDEEEEDRVLRPFNEERQNPERFSLQAILTDDLKHKWGNQAKLYFRSGAVQKGKKKNVSVVAEVRIPNDMQAVFVYELGIYPCAIGEVHANNKTTNAIESTLQQFFEDSVVVVVFVDAVLFSANKKGTNGKSFNCKAMVDTLGRCRALQDDLFLRLCNQLSDWRANSYSSSSYEFPVFAIAGRDMEENAYEKWKEANLVEESKPIFDECDFKVVICKVKSKDEDRSEALFILILGCDHPSAHLRGDPELRHRFKLACALKAAGLKLSAKLFAQCRRQSESGNESDLPKMFLNCLEECNKAFIESLKERREGLKKTLISLEISKDVATHSSLEKENGELRLNKEYAFLRQAQFEDDEVSENVKKFTEEFGKTYTAKWFKSKCFVWALCQKKTSANFVKRLEQVRVEFFNGDRDAFEKVFCDSFFAALANDEKSANFVKRLEQVRVEFFNGDRDAFEKVFCGSFFAALANDEKFENFVKRLEQVRVEFFNGDRDAFEKVFCDSFFAALANKEYEDFEKYIKNMNKIFAKDGGNDPKLLHSGSLHSAIAKYGENHMENTLDTVRTWPMFQGSKGEALLGKAMRDNSFISAIAKDEKNGGSFSRTMKKIHESPAFAGNEKALKNLFNTSTLLSELAKHGEQFLTALENEKKESYGDKNEEFATVLARTKRGKSRKITLPEFVKQVKRRMDQQQPTP